MRIGYGYDSHRFDAARPLFLGGVLIPGAPGLKGHSDADALVHAVIDALLGAAALGDIGSHFPDDDPRWKGADSAKLLEAVVSEVHSSGYRVVNIDATVICERPKLRAHVEAIRRRLSELLQIPVNGVSVKGKTNEKMDDVGAGIGVAVHCVALLEEVTAEMRTDKDVLLDLNPPDVVILANGEPPNGAALGLLAAARHCVACDGAVSVARSLGREPDFVVGDGDSASDEEAKSLGERFVRVEEQDTNDLAKAFRFAIGRFPDARRLVVLGAGGRREDHFMGNVSRLAGFAEELARGSGRPDDAIVAMVSGCGRFDVVVGERVFSSKPGDAVSVFAFHAGTEVTSTGLEWPLGGVALDELWKGTLNRAKGGSFALRTNRPLVVYRPLMT